MIINLKDYVKSIADKVKNWPDWKLSIMMSKKAFKDKQAEKDKYVCK